MLREGNFERLRELGARQYVDEPGRSRPLLTDREVRLLAISKGTLDDEERRHIENHVTHTLNFLRQIPWTSEIKNIPSIASAHHEKLDRSGYPAGLAASDRPYKKAVPWDRALDILNNEAAQGLIDADLLRRFRAAEVFRPSPRRPAS